VLESDQVAEHIPGCNMAFRREALESINGFDPQFRKAGDDVDICWRLQQAGRWITFVPGAFVWHHRRQGPPAYLRQQAGYGEAEALLRFKHPDKFNGRGDGKWRGMMYGSAHQGLRIGAPIVYSGTFATGFFQCIYQPGPAHWAMLPTTLEWHGVALLVAVSALFWAPAWIVACAMLSCSVFVAAAQAAQARLSPEHRGLASRLVLFLLCYAQPLVRSWYRYWTRLFWAQPPGKVGEFGLVSSGRLSWTGRRTLAYWTDLGHDRTDLLAEFNARLAKYRWGCRADSGWSSWDLEVDGYPGTVVQVQTVQENHGGANRLIRIFFRLRPRPLVTPCCIALLAATVAGTVHSPWSGLMSAGLISVLTWSWSRAMRLGGQITALFECVADACGLTAVPDD
jgi:hypothetical protein